MNPFLTSKALIGGLMINHYFKTLGRSMGVKHHVFNHDIEILWDEIPNPGKPVIVFLHGFSDRKESFYLAARHLHERYTIILPELPGFGSSRHYPDRRHTLPAYTEWLRALITSLPDERIHLAGNSLGGFIASLLAAELPEKTQSLTLINSAGFFLEPYNEFYNNVAQGRNPFMIQSLDDYEAFRKQVFYRQGELPFGVREHLARRMIVNRDWYLKIMNDTFEDGSLAAFFEKHNACDLKDLIRKIQVATNLMWGKEDAFFPWPVAKDAHGFIGHSRLEGLDRIGHCPHLENPERFARVFTGILERPEEKPAGKNGL